jgi:hypothetical protein
VYMGHVLLLSTTPAMSSAECTLTGYSPCCQVRVEFLESCHHVVTRSGWSFWVAMVTMLSLRGVRAMLSTTIREAAKVHFAAAVDVHRS